MAFHTHYRPTTSYQVSVVLIQRTDAFKSNLPVQSRNVRAIPSAAPIIDGVSPAVVSRRGFDAHGPQFHRRFARRYAHRV